MTDDGAVDGPDGHYQVLQRRVGIVELVRDIVHGDLILYQVERADRIEDGRVVHRSDDECQCYRDRVLPILQGQYDLVVEDALGEQCGEGESIDVHIWVVDLDEQVLCLVVHIADER